MTNEERDALITQALGTPEGKAQFRGAFQLACAKAADDPRIRGTWVEILARRAAGLPADDAEMRRRLEDRVKRGRK